MANRFADEIMQYFTGERGPFDSQIAFLSTRGGRFKDVYVMSANGDDVRRITNENTLNLSPSWTPDGRGAGADLVYAAATRICFRSRLPRGAMDQAVVAARPEPRRALVARRRRLAVTIEYDGNPDIALLNADGSLRSDSPTTGRSTCRRRGRPTGSRWHSVRTAPARRRSTS